MWRGSVGLLGLIGVLGAGCGASGPPSVVEIGSRNLKCPRTELTTVLNRKTPKVREYVVACDFMYTRVQCDDAGCRPAEVKPPCIGDAPCFEEDPVTLRWRLPAPGARAAR